MTPRSLTVLQRFSGAQTPSEASSATFVERMTDFSTETSTPYTPDDDPNSAYVYLRMRISELTTGRKPNETADASFLQTLRHRLEEVKRDYLFDEREAESAYNAERKKTDDLALQSRLRGDTVKPLPAAPRIKSPPRVESPNLREYQSSAGDVFDQDSDGEGAGGLFELLEEMPQSETTQEGVVVQVRDMPAPKGWSGKTPRTLLLELVHRTDKFANVSFSSTSGASRAKRAAVRIIWQQGNVSEWLMEDIACYDHGQAEQYIATVALHALAFPPTQGFAVGGAASANTLTSYRLLHPLYRDLWNELEENRRAEHDRINRDIWSKLRHILEPKLSGAKASFQASSTRYPLLTNDIKTPVKRPKGTMSAVPVISETEREQDALTSADIRATFEARQASVAYQEMLVSRMDSCSPDLLIFCTAST